jgi:acetyl-CoA acetyltransferase
MVLADRAWADKRGLAPTARLVSYGIAAVEPGMFGTCARGQAGLAARLGHSIR